MGFLGLIPAQQLKAVYYINDHVLLLQARGDAQNSTTGIAFHARPGAAGELVFVLMGWVGPLAPGRTPYEHGQRFEQVELHGDSITIEDANHPTGVQISVELIGGALTADAGGSAAQEVRRILFAGKLDLRAPALVPSQGSVTMAFDPTCLSLETAGIQNPGRAPEIAWDFRGAKIGETLVRITTSGGVARFITTRIVKVVIEPIATK
jgi:hypothetical protein